jgi:hypothetical protein
MKQNVGRLDKIIRLIIAGILAIVGVFFLTSSPELALGLFVGAGILAMTAVLGQCGLYRILGIDTCPLDKKK